MDYASRERQPRTQTEGHTPTGTFTRTETEEERSVWVYEADRNKLKRSGLSGKASERKYNMDRQTKARQK